MNRCANHSTVSTLTNTVPLSLSNVAGKLSKTGPLSLANIASKLSKTVPLTNPNFTKLVGARLNTQCGNHAFFDKVLERSDNDYGYWAGGAYHYNICDYLGNVRTVVKSDGTLCERNDYYPFGMLHDPTSDHHPPGLLSGIYRHQSGVLSPRSQEKIAVTALKNQVFRQMIIVIITFWK